MGNSHTDIWEVVRNKRHRKGGLPERCCQHGLTDCSREVFTSDKTNQLFHLNRKLSGMTIVMIGRTDSQPAAFSLICLFTETENVLNKNIYIYVINIQNIIKYNIYTI